MKISRKIGKYVNENYSTLTTSFIIVSLILLSSDKIEIKLGDVFYYRNFDLMIYSICLHYDLLVKKVYTFLKNMEITYKFSINSTFLFNPIKIGITYFNYIKSIFNSNDKSVFESRILKKDFYVKIDFQLA